MTTSHRGSCLCGAVRYAIDGRFEHFFLCHCERCRKDTGSAHAANLFSTTAQITWLSGADQVASFRLPGTRHARNFCKVCGSALPMQQGSLLVVPAGSLDDASDLRPDAHLFVASRAGWDHELEALPAFAQLPG